MVYNQKEIHEITDNILNLHRKVGTSALLPRDEDNSNGSSEKINQVRKAISNYIDKYFSQTIHQRCWPGDLEDQREQVHAYVLENLASQP
jgi:hypothetical protein